MSAKSAKLFMAKMNTNREFAQKVMEYEDTKLFMEFVNDEGYEFTGKELKEANQAIREDANRELQDDELDMVTGGIICFYAPCTNASTSAFCVTQRNP